MLQRKSLNPSNRSTETTLRTAVSGFAPGCLCAAPEFHNPNPAPQFCTAWGGGGNSARGKSARLLRSFVCPRVYRREGRCDSRGSRALPCQCHPSASRPPHPRLRLTAGSRGSPGDSAGPAGSGVGEKHGGLLAGGSPGAHIPGSRGMLPARVWPGPR